MISTLFIFINIVLLEIILSIDNASVLAVLVKKNLNDPFEQSKAMKYGIIGAFVFRGLSLLLVSWILYNPSFGAVFKIIGGLYLIRLWYTHQTEESDSPEEGNVSFLEKITNKLGINPFWSTVIMVEFIDIVFSIDNLLACVSLSSNIMVVVIAVCLGIVAMRFVATYFVKILNKYPSLEKSAFIVILLLGIKLGIAGIFDFFPETKIHLILNSHSTDLIFSLLTMAVFLYPILKPLKK